MNDLTWLPNRFLKDIILPKVIYEEYNYQNYKGYYKIGSNELIIVESDTCAATIAHEFCHYLQYINNKTIKGSTFKILNNSYEYSIKKFFTAYSWEMEALLFEYKYAKNWLNDWWLRKLVLE